MLEKIMSKKDEDKRVAIGAMLKYIEQLEGHAFWLEDKFEDFAEAASFAKIHANQQAQARNEFRRAHSLQKETGYFESFSPVVDDDGSLILPKSREDIERG